MRFFRFPLLAALGLPALVLLVAAPAEAQTLTVGAISGSSSSGIATISAAGTTASGTYTFSATANPTTTTYSGVSLHNASALTFQSGATISKILFNQNASTANIYGGSIHQILGYDSSVTNIYGGSVFYPMADGSSIGGVPGSGTINIYGGSEAYFSTQDTGVIDVFGTGLTETYLGTSSPFVYYQITGTLQDGTSLNVEYANNNGTLLFNGQAATAAPEPSQVTTLAISVLGLGILMLKSRRRSASA